MKKFEHLFSCDPMGAFEKIEDDYARYFEHAFKVKNEAVDEERMNTLKEGVNMSKKPYIELLPEYASVKGIGKGEEGINKLAKKFADAFGGEEIAKSFFSEFISKGLMRGLMEYFTPYGHQIGMMEKAFAGEGVKYKNTVITAGTGSGKTESFLLPLLANIFKEAQSWGQAANHKNWYEGVLEGRSHTPRYTPKQREGDSRPAALRAIVLYPMNALVEDQMARLREALDSTSVRTFMNTHFKGNRFYFGGYNGDTIAKKNYDLLSEAVKNGQIKKGKLNQMRQNVAKQLKSYQDDFTKIKKWVEVNKKEDALYISPRLEVDDTTAEMITRWDMQKWAPDIMITNTSMLSIMLMRKAEAPIFEQTKKWLNADDIYDENEKEEAKKNRIFHIVVDELHLYRGTAGSEVACLLRMLYDAIGLPPVIVENGYLVPNPQLRILASSASLGDEDATEKFMEEFFGVYSTIEGEKVFNIQEGTNREISDENKDINYELFKNLTHENFVELEGDDVADKQQNVVNDFLENNFNCNSVKDFCNTYQNQIFYDFYSALPTNVDKDNKPINGSKRPISQEQLVKTLFNGNEEALKGFFIFRGYVDTVYKDHKLPRFRFHKFFKYIEGLWGELNPDLNRPVKHLSYTAEEVGKDGNKVLELLRCENCGELYIGGNRKVENGCTYLTLNYPNLNQIPNFNPTPMVQNKSYQEYAIFWTHDINDAPELTDEQYGANDLVASKVDGKSKRGNGHAKWIPGHLDPVTGEFIPYDPTSVRNRGSKTDCGIPGFIYKVVEHDAKHEEISPDAAQTIYAAPCTCPFCLQDYATRKYTKSPIRSFRTGIDRSNQIISKELIYQLDKSSAKLIGFSDSREDAATQALGIEREHYRDMVRMLFVECIEEMGKEDIDKVVNYVNSERQVGTHSFDILTKVSNKFKDILNAVEIANLYLRGQSISHLIPSVFPLNTLIGEYCDGKLVKKLLELGINPAGWEYRFQWYKEDKKNEDSRRHHWSTAFDFKEYKFTRAFSDAYADLAGEIITQLTNAIFANSFGKYMGVSVLDSGIGYICCTRSAEIENSTEYQNLKRLLPDGFQVYEFVDAVIRVMGDNYLYPSVDDTKDRQNTYEGLKAAVKKPIEHFCSLHNITDTDLGVCLVKFLLKYCTEDYLILDINKLSFQKMTDSTYIKCEKCGRVHPHMGFGFCTNVYCKEPLDPKKEDPQKTVTLEELHKHYISHDILVERRKPSKLHTEELTGQTDDIQTRLREFKDIILVDDDFHKRGKEKTLPIDMVCVTTTMEVGVDIGSLQAIFQGNMPPTRYNYQQRVGRCGRRNKAFSTAFTFCRGRSHDVYYYNHATDEMVGGIPATPALSLAPYTDSNGKKKMKKAIMKRVIVKDLLHQAFANLPFDYDLQDTSGEFGRIGEWEKNGKRLEEWIQDNPESVNNTVKRYLSQFNNGDQIEKDINEIVDWINNSLVTEINYVVNKTSIYDMGLAKYLTETGFLPMYGMPSDARNFYHGYDYVKQEPKSIDRSSEMAISEFAPGAEKTKDKGKYRIEGITIPIKGSSVGRNQLGFYDSDGDALADRYVISFEKDLENNSAESNNISDIIEVEDKNQGIKDLNLAKNQKIIVIPQAYRSLKIMGNRGTPEENNDRGSSFVQSQIWAKETCTTKEDIPKEIDNVSVSMHGLGMNEDPTVWHINSNNGHFYTGSFSAHGLGDPKKRGSHANFLFYQENGNNNIQKITDGYDIALGSKKVTEMIKLKLKSWPECLDLSLNTGNRSAIRAAFYSAAFLLQRALADRLDVQPDEIEICEKIDDPNGCPAIILSDALANGAGIVSYLFEDGKLKELIESIVNFKSFDPPKSDEESFMHSLIADDHKENCLTACQKCLLAYNNRGFHHVLDWRLGVGILRLMIDPEFDFGFSCNNIDKYKELTNQNRVFEMAAKKLNKDDSEHKHYWIDSNHARRRTNETECTIVYHPLWNKEAAIKNCKNIPTNATIKMYNTFRLLRSDISADDNPENIADIIGNQAAQPTPATTSSPVANAAPRDTDVNNIAPDIDLD